MKQNNNLERFDDKEDAIKARLEGEERFFWEVQKEW